MTNIPMLSAIGGLGLLLATNVVDAEPITMICDGQQHLAVTKGYIDRHITAVLDLASGSFQTDGIDLTIDKADDRMILLLRENSAGTAIGSLDRISGELFIEFSHRSSPDRMMIFAKCHTTNKLF
jgi:hypothetical protein